VTDPNALAGIVFTHLDARSKPALAAARKARTEKLFVSEKHAVIDPETGVLLGFEQRKAGTTKAVVDDMAQLLPYVAEKNPDELRDIESYPQDDPDILALLRRHLPDKIATSVEITEQHLNYLTKKAASDSSFRPPGITVTTGEGTTAFYPENPEAIESVLHRGYISLAAPAKPELTEGDA
jgi:hypothetical protein